MRRCLMFGLRGNMINLREGCGLVGVGEGVLGCFIMVWATH